MTSFIPGLTLSALFYSEIIQPLLDRHVPGLVYSAARLHTGSEVLGFDTPRSTDHEWGPRLDLLLSPGDVARFAPQLDDLLAHEIPATFHGYSTHFAETHEAGVRRIEAHTGDGSPIAHGIRITDVGSFFMDYLGLDPRQPLSAIDWLTLPGQKLRTIRSGRVFHDGLGELTPIRERLDWYPHNLWLYLLAAQWTRIGQEEAFVGRTAEVGDEIGSRVIAARLVREIMRLGFLIERQYAPYSKWFGTAWSKLAIASRLEPTLSAVLRADTPLDRETALTEAYTIMAEQHNALGVTPPLPVEVSRFHNRPFLVIHADRFATALRDTIRDPAIHRLPFPIGAIDQWADSTDVLDPPAAFRRLRAMYADEPPS